MSWLVSDRAVEGRVLVVDDEDQIRKVVGTTLKKGGYEGAYGWYVTAMAIVFFVVSLRLPRQPRYLDHA